jgi:nicotinate dehydrogenase subunit B
MSQMTLQSTSIFGAELSRRGFITAGGALLVYAGIGSRAAHAEMTTSLDPTRSASWIEVRADNTVQFRTGKCDFGQSSIYTAYPQIIAEELGVPFEAVASVISGDTDRTPDGGGTFGLLRTNVLNLRKAAAYTREALLAVAAEKLGVPKDQLTVSAGVVSGGGKSLSYGEIVKGQDLKLVIPTKGNMMDFGGLLVDGTPPLKPVSSYTIVGKPYQNPSLVPKITGRTIWASDVKLPGMLHGRVIHPPTLGSTLVKAGKLDAKAYPNVRVIVKGSFLGVVAPDEWQAIQAAQDVAATTEWTEWKGLPGSAGLHDHLRQKADFTALPATKSGASKGDAAAAIAGAAKVHSASYNFPYLKHAPIGPAIATADVRPDGSVTVHTNSQNPQYLRKGIAIMLGSSADKVVIRSYPGSGHYGRSNGGNAGAEDQAVLLSQAVGRPVRVQWMRAEDLQWSTQSSAMVTNIRIALGADGRIAGYQGDHYGPPMQDDRLVGALLAGLPTIGAPGAPNEKVPQNGQLPIADRWIYDTVANVAEAGHGTWQVGEHESPLHVGLRDHSMRTPIQFQQNFPRELAITEAAALANADALQFRLDHIKEPRFRDIIARLRTESGWQTRPSPSPQAASTGDRPARGRGVSTLFRDNGYWACAAEVSVMPSTGAVTVERVTLVLDVGIVVNPLQLKRQVEAGCLMGVSIALHEEVTFDAGAVTLNDWSTYPILRMDEIPEVKVVIVPRPEAGIYGQGSETSNALAASAIAGAVFDATGKPPRRLPLRSDIVKGLLST